MIHAHQHAHTYPSEVRFPVPSLGPLSIVHHPSTARQVAVRHATLCLGGVSAARATILFRSADVAYSHPFLMTHCCDLARTRPLMHASPTRAAVRIRRHRPAWLALVAARSLWTYVLYADAGVDMR